MLAALRAWAARLQREVTALWLAARDPRTPWLAKALAGFDVERFRPELVCIEAHPQVRQQILDYFARHRYIVVGKYLRADVNNLYFTPIP